MASEFCTSAVTARIGLSGPSCTTELPTFKRQKAHCALPFVSFLSLLNFNL